MTSRAPGLKPLTPVDLHILLALARSPLHGYGIKLDISERTRGEVSLGSGTLYEAIQRLEERNLIAPTAPPQGEETDPRRRYYRLRAAGERALREALGRMETVVRFGRSLDLLPEGREV